MPVDFRLEERAIGSLVEFDPHWICLDRKKTSTKKKFSSMNDVINKWKSKVVQMFAFFQQKEL